MHSYDLRRTIDDVLFDAAQAEPFFHAVGTLAMVFDSMAEPLLMIAEGGNRLTEATTALHTRFSALSRVTAGINPRRFYQALERLQEGLHRLAPPALPDDRLISELSKGVEEFAALYDAFLSRPSGKTAIPLILNARTLHDRLPVLINALAVLRAAHDEAPPPNAQSASLSLVLPAVSTLPDYAQRLLALDALYAETCVLLSVSRVEHPLRVARIESDGLWLHVFGEARAMGWIAEFIQASASFMYQNYATEGKLSDAVLNLTQRLKDAGIDSTRAAQHVARSAPVIFKNLGLLIERQPSVTVNHTKVSIGDELNRVLLQGHTVPHTTTARAQAPQPQPVRTEAAPAC